MQLQRPVIWRERHVILKQFGLYEYFDKIVCTSMVEHGKPAPDVYEYACSQIGLAPEECMAVEDSPNGIKSACAAGCKVVYGSGSDTAG